jgi:hypothetical protein
MVGSTCSSWMVQRTPLCLTRMVHGQDEKAERKLICMLSLKRFVPRPKLGFHLHHAKSRAMDVHCRLFFVIPDWSAVLAEQTGREQGCVVCSRDSPAELCVCVWVRVRTAVSCPAVNSANLCGQHQDRGHFPLLPWHDTRHRGK